MILIDASVWIDHMRRAEPDLVHLLSGRQLLMHAFAIGEVLLGSIARSEDVIKTLNNLPRAPLATHEEVLALIESEALHGIGIGYVDVHLLASARLANAKLWTRDRRLGAAASRFGLRASFDAQS